MRVIQGTLLLLMCIATGYVMESDHNSHSDRDGDWESFPIARGGGAILLPVEVAGEVYPFLLDSGSSHHSLDITLRKHLGIPLGSGIAYGSGASEMHVETFNTPPMRVGTFQMPPPTNGTSPVFDFARVRQALEQDVRGALGAPFFREKLVQIDFDQGILRIADCNNERGDLGKPLPLRLDKSGVPWLDNVRIGSRTESFEIATGKEFRVELHKWLFNALLADGQLRIEKVSSTSETYAGPRTLRRGRLATFFCGGYRHDDVLVHEGDENALGLGYMARYVLTLDVTGGRMYLRPGKRFNQRDNVDRSGLTMDKSDDVLTVVAVSAGTPADLAGVLLGDKISAIDGDSCQGMRLHEFKQRMRDSVGKQLTIKVDRHGRQIEVTMNLNANAQPAN